ncbi:MAG: hypothetical protein NTY39_00725 [Campylobacterales bacterium]|nr:hypothetical protein [Campylobacterales bacterium]
MFNGLSLDQAPPISVVLRFFLTLPVFGLILSLFMIFFPIEILTPNHPFSLAGIHLLFLGMISMGMIGALFQMQSVLGGAPIPSPLGNSIIIHTLLSAGILALAGAFILQLPELFIIAAVLLGSGIVYFAQILLPLLLGKMGHDTLKGMRFALFSLLITAILGVVMASSYANGNFENTHAAIKASHYSIGLIGWVAALIIYVAFQVVEMFYVTTPYSDWCKNNVKRILGISLLLKVIWLFTALQFPWVFDIFIALLLVGFVITTVKRLRSRKRRVSDVSIWFWMMGMGLLMISLLSYGALMVRHYEPLEAMSLIAFALFALSIILGMMGKIVPFLVWFHLNAAGYMETPIMSNIIPAKRLKMSFLLFGFTALTALLSPFFPLLLIASGLSGVVLFSLLLFNLVAAAKLYRNVLATGTRFTFEP